MWGEINQDRIRIDVINPSPESFVDHGTDADYFGEQVYMIPNDHLMYRSASIKSNSIRTAVYAVQRLDFAYVPFY